MKAVSTGYTIPIPISRIVYSQDKQCPGLIIIQCPGIIIIQCPGIIMSYKTVTREHGILLNRFPVLRGIIQTSRFQVLFLHVKLCLNILNQCPGVITMRILKPPKWLTMLSALPCPLRKRGIENTEEKDVREREKTKLLLLFMMRAWPVRAQQFQAVQSFQQK